MTTNLGGAFRALGGWEQAAYAEHLKRLDPATRRLRFHRSMSDEALEQHAARAFERHVHVIAWFHHAAVHGAAEVALFDGPNGKEAEAAFAVERPFRACGIGGELMHRAALYARNRNASELHIATEVDNAPMLRLAKRSGADFEIIDTDAEGVLHQHPRTVYSLMLETFEEETGLFRWSLDALMACAQSFWRDADAKAERERWDQTG